MKGEPIYRIDYTRDKSDGAWVRAHTESLVALGVLVPVEPERNEVWPSDPFGAYRVIDDNDTVVDTVTDVRRKVYLGAEIGGDDDECPVEREHECRRPCF